MSSPANPASSDNPQSPDVSGPLDRYFTEFLVEKLHRPLLPQLRKLSVVCAIRITGAVERTWTLTIIDGMLDSVSARPSAPACTFTLNATTLAAIISGKLSPQMAFFKRQVEIAGGIETGLRLAFVLGDFFKTYPYTVEIAP